MHPNLPPGSPITQSLAELETLRARLRGQLPPLPVTPHPREALMYEGWLATRWLGSVLAGPSVPPGPLGAVAHATELARALALGLQFELALDNTPYLGSDDDSQRVRVAQELVWAHQSIAQAGMAGTPRSLLRDLVERAEELFGDKTGPLLVATPEVESSLTPEELRMLITTFAVAGAIVVSILGCVLACRL